MKIYEATIYQLNDALDHAKLAQDDFLVKVIESSIHLLKSSIEQGNDSQELNKYEQ